MRLKYLILLSFLCFISQQMFAKKHVADKLTVATPEEDYYDVHYVKIDLNATNLSTSISGNSITRGRVVSASMAAYFFELTPQLHIDSAKFNGQVVNVDSVSTFVRKIVLLNPLSQNTYFTAQVFYHGAPTGGTGFFTVGILNGTAGNPAVHVTHTVSAAYHSRDWFPCKQSLRDKIDSADVWITVDSNLNVASNGLLKNITTVTSSQKRYEWHTKYPIDYYLLSFCVAPYNEHNYYMHFNGSNDSMLVQNYYYNDTTTFANSHTEMDSVQYIINYFSGLFGRYPFDKEKTGTCLVPLGGGMENQTLVSVGSLEMQLMAHELSHQWWGDHVTCGNITDMWLNEGLATYCEHLFLEHFRSTTQVSNYRAIIFSQVMSLPFGSVIVSDTTNESRIYDARLTYYKGASVTHMLRYLINNDSLFFQTLRNYQQQFSNGNAITQDMNTIANQVSGQTLDTFFNQWINKEGFPTYSAKWAQGGNKVCIKLKQTTSWSNSVSVFKLPVEIKLQSPQGDTVIKVYNDQSTQFYTIFWNNTMTGLEIDPNDQIVNKQGLIVNDTTLLSVNDNNIKPIIIFPNPTNDSWTIQHLVPNSSLELIDMYGKTLWKEITTSDSMQVPTLNLPIGNYILNISSSDEARMSFLLTKQ